MKRNKYSDIIGELFEVPLENGGYGIVQRAFIDKNFMSLDLLILFKPRFTQPLQSFNYDSINKMGILAYVYANSYARIRHYNWKYLYTCTLPINYKIPLFKEYTATNDDFDGIRKWKIYDPVSGQSDYPLSEKEAAGLVSRIGFAPQDIAKWIETGHHGLNHEMFG